MKLHLLLLLLVTSSAFAQDMLNMFRPGPSGHSMLLRERFYGDAKVQGSTRRVQQRDWQGRVNGTMWTDKGWEVTGGIDANDVVFHHPSPLLNTYRTFQGSLGARRYGVTNQVRAMNVTYGSSSDRPFAKVTNDTASATYVHQFNEKWWGIVNWSNNRTFLNNIPLPGVFYVAKATRQETLLFGFPAVVWRKRFDSGFETQYAGFLPYNHTAHIGWYWNENTGVFLSYEHTPRVFFRNNRESIRDRLFFVEQKAMLELKGAIVPRKLNWEFGVGQAFNRSVYEAKNFTQDKDFNIKLGDTLLVAGQITAQF